MKTVKYIFLIIITIFTEEQTYASNLNFTNKPQMVATATILAAVTYGIYHYANQIPAPLIPQANTTNFKSIIFDLDGVLCTTNKLQVFYQIDAPAIKEYKFPPTLHYMADQITIPSEKALFDSLALVPALSTYKSYNKGLEMPQMMIDWQTGARNLAELQQTIIDHFQTSPLPETQKSWALASALWMIHPEKFIATRQTIPANIKLLHELKEKGYKLYILSNWDPNSFSLFQAQFPEIFTYKNQPIFDDIMISGNVGVVKPEALIFKKSLEKFNLSAINTIFIDDESANIQAAQKAGIKTILADPNNSHAVRKDLVNLLTN